MTGARSRSIRLITDVNVPNFPLACLTPAHTTAHVRTRCSADLDAAIVARVLALSRDGSVFVLGIISISPREAVLVSQRPLGAASNVCVGATVRDKG
jgi:hypothetical protein